MPESSQVVAVLNLLFYRCKSGYAYSLDCMRTTRCLPSHRSGKISWGTKFESVPGYYIQRSVTSASWRLTISSSDIYDVSTRPRNNTDWISEYWNTGPRGYSTPSCMGVSDINFCGVREWTHRDTVANVRSLSCIMLPSNFKKGWGELKVDA